MALTKRQREVLDCVTRFIEQRGYSPSLEEIAQGVGCSSVATVHKHLANLQAKGAIRRVPNCSRSVELETVGTLAGAGRSGTVEIPVLGQVAAGRPIEAIAHADAESLGLPEDLVRGRETFALRVRGNSMIEDQIRDGDLILVERMATAENAQTVVALIDGRDVTVKKWHRQEDGHIRLEPANADVKPLILPAERVAVVGRVIGLLRKY